MESRELGCQLEKKKMDKKQGTIDRPSHPTDDQFCIPFLFQFLLVNIPAKVCKMFVIFKKKESMRKILLFNLMPQKFMQKFKSKKE